jgi:uncharacterized protein (TIGR03435 family)
MKPAIGGFILLTAIGLAQSPGAAPMSRPEFEVASIRPDTSGTNMVSIRPPAGGRFTTTNSTVKMLVGLAYRVQGFEISGGPGWIDSDGYDINARAAESNLTLDQLRPMVQALLEDRFKLMVHREMKEMPIYAVLPARSGTKLAEPKEGGCVMPGTNSPPDNPPKSPTAPSHRPLAPCGGFIVNPNRLVGGNISMTQLANVLSSFLGRPVIDKTGFAGKFDVELEFSPDGIMFGPGGVGASGVPPSDTANADTSRPSIFTALQEQLGLRLDSQKGPGEILVIDRVERPGEN